MFAAVRDNLDKMLIPKDFIGRAPSQVEEFVGQEVEPILALHKNLLGAKETITV